MKLISMIQIHKSIEIAKEKNHSLTNSIKKQISVISFNCFVLTNNQIIFSILFLSLSLGYYQFKDDIAHLQVEWKG